MSRVAARLRGFGPLGILASLVILLVGNYPVAPLGGVLALVWVRWSGTPWGEIGYVRPRSWARDLAIGIAFGIGFKLLMKVPVRPSSNSTTPHESVDKCLEIVRGGKSRTPGP